MHRIAALTLLAVLGSERSPGSPRPPRIEIEAPPELGRARARVASYDVQRLVGIVQLVGLTDPGPPIRVVLASEHSAWADEVPPSTAGLAFSEAGVIVLFPARAPAYPHDTLEDVLRHEVAHVLIARAAGGRDVPRWFHEGLAMGAERAWDFQDRTRLIYELTLSRAESLGQIDRFFAGNRGARTRAYALAGAFVRDIRSRHGSGTPGEILGHIARDVSFETGFARATGIALRDAEAAFWRRQRLWTTWIPFLASATALWMAVTLLAVYAIRKRRQKSAALRRRWAEEDGEF